MTLSSDTYDDFARRYSRAENRGGIDFSLPGHEVERIRAASVADSAAVIADFGRVLADEYGVEDEVIAELVLAQAVALLSPVNLMGFASFHHWVELEQHYAAVLDFLAAVHARETRATA